MSLIWASTLIVQTRAIPEIINPEAQAALTTIVNRHVGSDQFPAIFAAVSVRGRIIASVAVGKRRLDGTSTVKITDRVMIGSISKGVTAMVIAMLVDQRKLEWTSRVKDALPDLAREFRDHPAIEATYIDLISHRSGLPRGDEHKFVDKSGQEWRVNYARAMFRKAPLAGFREGVHYSAGGSLAALMAETTLKTTFEELSDETLFKRFGLTSFGWGKPWEKLESEPMGLVLQEGRLLHPQEGWNTYIKHDPSGGMHCNINDLCRYATMLAFGGTGGIPGFNKPISTSLIERFGNQPGSGGGATGLGDYSEVYVDPKAQLAIACVVLMQMQDGGQARVQAIIGDVKRAFYGQ